MNYNVVVLVSCMHQNDTSILHKMNIQTDAVIVNQCNRDSVELIRTINKAGNEIIIKYINTTTRGLSNSRNMAINNVQNKHSICLLCDEDEVLYDNYVDLIIEGYKYHKYPDIVAFAIDWTGFGKKYSNTPHKLNYLRSLKVCSVQITFKIESIRCNNIVFDVLMGSGTGNGAGEENKFMMDCRKHHLSMMYYPNRIAYIDDANNQSQWFHGYDKQYFENFGWAARRIHPNFLLAFLYVLYYSIRKYNLYRESIPFFVALKLMIKGLFIQK